MKQINYKDAYESVLIANKMLDNKIENLQQRIDEAIEYLTDEGVCIMNKGMQENERLCWDWQNYYEILAILRGDSDE